MNKLFIYAALLTLSLDANADDVISEDRLARLANIINKQLPQKLDEYTELNSVTAEPGKTFFYHYILAKKGADIDKNEFTKFIKPILLSNCKINKGMIAVYKNGITVVHEYKGNDGILVNRYEIKPSDCGY